MIFFSFYNSLQVKITRKTVTRRNHTFYPAHKHGPPQSRDRVFAIKDSMGRSWSGEKAFEITYQSNTE